MLTEAAAHTSVRLEFVQIIMTLIERAANGATTMPAAVVNGVCVTARLSRPGVLQINLAERCGAPTVLQVYFVFVFGIPMTQCRVHSASWSSDAGRCRNVVAARGGRRPVPPLL